MKASLSKKDRLKSRKRIGQLFSAGARLQVFPFVVHYVLEPAGDAVLQAGFGVSARSFRKAVDRNRVKRVTREVYRNRKAALREALAKSGRSMFVFFVYTGRELPDGDVVSQKVAAIIQRLIEVVHAENTQVD